MNNHLTSYQTTVKLPNIINRVISLAIFASFLLGIIWSKDGIGPGAKILFALTLINILLWFIQYKGYSVIAGVIAFLTMTVGITILAIRQDGYYNVPAIGYPILVIISGLLFGKRYVLPYTGLTLAILVYLNYLESIGIILPFDGQITYYAGDFVTVLILQTAIGVLLFLLLFVIENNIEKIIQSEVSLKETYDLTLMGLAKSLEVRGYKKERHHIDIGELTKKFGVFLNLDEQTIEDLFKGALLHDIGMMGIPDKILLKPGPLTDEEFKTVKTHTLIGIEILKDVPELDPVREIVYSHHEQWDGKGYPKGLAKEEIPMGAQIFAIIDNWVALTNDLIYRKAWKKNKALRYLKEEAGNKFNLALTNKFIEFISGTIE